MAKKITNASLGVIFMPDGQACIPGGDAVIVADEVINHPLIDAYIVAKKLTVENVDEPEAEQKADSADFDAMTLLQLKAYAAANNIDLAGATAKADILAIVKASV